MHVTCRHLRFLLRWVFLYNAELVWLSWRLPRRVPEAAALPAAADERRLQAYAALASALADGGAICAACGRCCLERVNRFTPFDQIIRRGASAPAPAGDRRIYSLPWMAWNGLRHAAQRLLPRRRRKTAPPCVHLTPAGCGLARPERPMICVSWFCPAFVLAMHWRGLAAAEAPLRAIEALHREAAGAARNVSNGRLPAAVLRRKE